MTFFKKKVLQVYRIFHLAYPAFLHFLVPNKVHLGVVPNQYGTWPYGRAGWCPGQQVEWWEVDVTKWFLGRLLQQIHDFSPGGFGWILGWYLAYSQPWDFNRFYFGPRYFGDFKIKELIGILRMFINVIGGYHVISFRNIAKLWVVSCVF